MNEPLPLELLAPARDLKTGIRAIEAGADAVFIGGPAFGARHSAGNSLEDLKTLCAFAHRFGARVHVTLNTLLKDEELPEAQKLISAYGECGADALIIQDPALLSLNFPEGLELHASTQCDIATPERLRFWKDLGMAQAVLPRELSIEEILAFHKAVPGIRLEAFIAGALCCGESGICYISEQLTARSANRGECAQICRLPMELRRGGEAIASGCLLSMKDNWAGSDLKALAEAGVTCFKIEGRLKDASYVANVTARMRTLLDEVIAASGGRFCALAKGTLSCGFTPDERRTFNRGFTDAMLHGDNRDLINPITPKFEGPETCKVISVRQSRGLAEIACRALKGVTLANGDGFTFVKGGELQGFRANSVRAEGAAQVLSVRGRIAAAPGTVLRRNYDAAFERDLSAPGAVSRVMEHEGELEIKEGTLCYTVRDGLGREGRASCAYVFDPEGRALAPEKIRAILMKHFDAHFAMKNVRITGDEARLTVPASLLNNLRKSTCGDLLDKVQACRATGRWQRPEALPQYPEPYTDPRLIKSAQCRRFWEEAGALKTEPPALIARSAMTCRHCLIKAYGQCKKDGGQVSGYELFLGGKSFRVICDSARCRMHLVPEIPHGR